LRAQLSEEIHTFRRIPGDVYFDGFLLKYLSHEGHAREVVVDYKYPQDDFICRRHGSVTSFRKSESQTGMIEKKTHHKEEGLCSQDTLRVTKRLTIPD
jgi:hypothetical protein